MVQISIFSRWNFSIFILLSLAMDLASFKITFDGILQTYVQNKVEEAQKLINDKKIDSFIDYISSFIFSGGKRIRPY